MKIACFVPYPLGCAPSQRFRIEQWAPHLARDGIQVDFLPFFTPATYRILYRRGFLLHKVAAVARGGLARLSSLRASRRYDVAIVHREALPLGVGWIEGALARRLPLVFDLDDAIWLPNVSGANAAFLRLKGFAKIDRIIARSAAVTAGCRYLAEHAEKLNPHVHVVPTSIEVAHYDPPRAHAPTETLTIGWTGSATTAAYLKLIEKPLRALASQQPLRLIVQGADVRMPGIETECVPWAPETEVATLRRFDVGLKPLPRDEWVRGKCPMKELQYMALGIPAVATAFGSSAECIDHGKTGYLCDTPQDWIDAITALRDPAHRARVGAAARRGVVERYDARRAAAQLARVLRWARERAGERAGRRASQG